MYFLLWDYVAIQKSLVWSVLRAPGGPWKTIGMSRMSSWTIVTSFFSSGMRMEWADLWQIAIWQAAQTSLGKGKTLMDSMMSIMFTLPVISSRCTSVTCFYACYMELYLIKSILKNIAKITAGTRLGSLQESDIIEQKKMWNCI